MSENGRLELKAFRRGKKREKLLYHEAISNSDTYVQIMMHKYRWRVGWIVPVEDFWKKIHGSEIRTIDFDGGAMMGIYNTTSTTHT